MPYNSKQLKNGRWGIFVDNQLVASIGCSDTCQKILRFLETRLSNHGIPTLTEIHGGTQYFHDMKLRP